MGKGRQETKNKEYEPNSERGGEIRCFGRVSRNNSSISNHSEANYVSSMLPLNCIFPQNIHYN